MNAELRTQVLENLDEQIASLQVSVKDATNQINSRHLTKYYTKQRTALRTRIETLSVLEDAVRKDGQK